MVVVFKENIIYQTASENGLWLTYHPLIIEHAISGFAQEVARV